MHGPKDVRIVGGQFGDDLSRTVVPVNPETGRLSLERPFIIFVKARRPRRRISHLRSDEVLVFATTDARNADGWVDGCTNNFTVTRFRVTLKVARHNRLCNWNAIGISPEFGRSLVYDLACVGDTAGRGVIQERVPGIISKILAVGSLPARIYVLSEDRESGDMDGRALCLIPPHRRAVKGHAIRVCLVLNEEVEAGLLLLEPRPQLLVQVAWVLGRKI
jgi:hypothetical protein